MRYGFKDGAVEAKRLARTYADANGLGGLVCVDAQSYEQPPGTLVEKGVTHWTVRFRGLPRGPFDDGSVVVLIRLDTGEVRRLGGVRGA